MSLLTPSETAAWSYAQAARSSVAHAPNSKGRLPVFVILHANLCSWKPVSYHTPQNLQAAIGPNISIHGMAGSLLQHALGSQAVHASSQLEAC